ncbi:methionyl-tRNA formyltransferase, partial [Chloroflexota bacterium]
AGDAFTGVSIILMDEGLDTGPVIAKAQLPVLDNDTTASLGLKLSLVAARLLPDVLPDWAKGRLEAKPQPEDGVTCSGTLDKEDGRIDWRETAVSIWRKVRAFQPWPGCHTSWRGRMLKIIEAVPLPDGVDANAGQVIAISRKSFAVATGDGILRVLKLQLEGKRVVTAAEFLAGQHNFIGALLPD